MGKGAELLIPETVQIPAGRPEPTGPGPATVPTGPFRLGRTPVINREYACFVAAGGAPAPPWFEDPDFRSPRQPVVGITWHEAAAYCAWLSRTTGGRWRLPEEAEWEHAIRGGLSAARTAWGELVPPGEIPDGPLAGPWEAGRGTSNGYGILDPGTIVHEWCNNWHAPDAGAGPSSNLPPRRASRGGSWRHKIRWSSPAARSSLPPDYRYSDYGFRVLLEEGPEP